MVLGAVEGEQGGVPARRVLVDQADLAAFTLLVCQPDTHCMLQMA